MTSQHTPGPWIQSSPDARMVVTGNRGQMCIAEVFGALGRNPVANARLIAAAPDLLDALIASRPWIVTDRNTFAECARARGLNSGAPDIGHDDAIILAGYDAAIDAIDAAIAKATGEPV